MVIYRTEEGEPEARGIYPVHEEYLKNAAKKAARISGFEDQKAIIEKRVHEVNPMRISSGVWIVIDQQINYDEERDAAKRTVDSDGMLWTRWREADVLYRPNDYRRYCGPSWPEPLEEWPRFTDTGELCEEYPLSSDPDESKKIPTKDGIDRQRLMQCSGLAYDHFTYNPMSSDLHLPVTYPRCHGNTGNGGSYWEAKRVQRAHIIPQPFEITLIPWLLDDTNFPEDGPPNDIPLPDDMPLLDMIHLYNAMLQLAMPRFLQRPLIEKLCKALYCTPLSKCELETLEVTVGHLNKNSVAVLDPVICSLVGSYGLRDRNDRNPKPPGDEYEEDEGDTRGCFQYGAKVPEERKLPDTVILPPPLPVLGHGIRHFSGVRDTGDSRAAHVGYPLHIGKSAYYKREDTVSEEAKAIAEDEHHIPEVWHDTYIPGELRRLPSYDLLRPLAYLRNNPGHAAGEIS